MILSVNNVDIGYNRDITYKRRPTNDHTKTRSSTNRQKQSN